MVDGDYDDDDEDDDDYSDKTNDFNVCNTPEQRYRNKRWQPNTLACVCP
jgi:hypothetical protein